MAALLGACDVIQDGRHLGRHLGFHQNLEIVKKTLKIVNFLMLDMLLFVNLFCICHLKG